MDTVISTNYNGDNPLLTINVMLNKQSFSIDAYLDTGCTKGLVITQRDLQRQKITPGKPINPLPERVELADGTYIAGYLYPITVEFADQKISSTLMVLHPKIKTFKKNQELEEEDGALLGREIMDGYRIEFNGLVNPRQFNFIK